MKANLDHGATASGALQYSPHDNKWENGINQNGHDVPKDTITGVKPEFSRGVLYKVHACMAHDSRHPIAEEEVQKCCQANKG